MSRNLSYSCVEAHRTECTVFHAVAPQSVCGLRVGATSRSRGNEAVKAEASRRTTLPHPQPGGLTPAASPTLLAPLATYIYLDSRRICLGTAFGFTRPTLCLSLLWLDGATCLPYLILHVIARMSR